MRRATIFAIGVLLLCAIAIPVHVTWFGHAPRDTPCGRARATRQVGRETFRWWFVSARYWFENRPSKPSYDNQIGRFRDSGQSQLRGILPVGFHTRQVVSNDNTYHCARNMGACTNSGARTV